MRLLVVGATGSLGRLAVAEAIERGHEVAALVRDPARANLTEPVVKVRGDVLDLASLDPAVAGKDGRRAPRRQRKLVYTRSEPLRAMLVSYEARSIPVCLPTGLPVRAQLRGVGVRPGRREPRHRPAESA